MAWENKTSVSWQAATRKKVDWRTCYSSIAVYHSLQDLAIESLFLTRRDSINLTHARLRLPTYMPPKNRFMKFSRLKDRSCINPVIEENDQRSAPVMANRKRCFHPLGLLSW